MAAQNFQMAGHGAPSRWKKRELGGLKLPLQSVGKNVNCLTQEWGGEAKGGGGRTNHPHQETVGLWLF